MHKTVMNDVKNEHSRFEFFDGAADTQDSANPVKNKQCQNEHEWKTLERPILLVAAN